MKETRNFLGSGWKFPPQLDSRGRIALSHQEQDVEEAIRMILMTRKGERPMRPEFGSDLHQLAFMPNDAGTAGTATRYIMESLARWEPRIEVTEVITLWDNDRPSVLILDLRYRIVATNSERNLVFPFYTIPGED